MEHIENLPTLKKQGAFATLLSYFKSKQRLRDEYNKACEKNARINDIIKKAEVTKFVLWEDKKSYAVTKQINYRDKSGSVDIIIKRFPKGEDAEYAQLCAQELYDKLTEEM